MSTIPINSLSPTEPPPSNASIRGVVTLFWPYSSSTRQCAFLIADPDFRLRNKQGQVRVRFTGASAEAVAKSHVGIGDEVLLALHGANWEEDPEATRTPGKSVGGELFFRRKLQLVVTRTEGDVQVNVDAPLSPPRSVEQDTSEIATPQPRVRQLRPSLGRAGESSSYAYTSPAFVKRLRLSGESFLNSAFDPFAEEDGPRATFGRSTNWRYTAGTPSPTKDTSTVLDNAQQESPVRAQRSNTPLTSEPEEVLTEMPPPPRPKLQLRSASPPLAEETVEEQDGPSTPKLHPVRSPTLPLPSPFPVEGSEQSHFPDLAVPAHPEVQIEELPDLSMDTTKHGDDIVMVDTAQAMQLSETEHAGHISPTATPAQFIPQPQTPTKIPPATRVGFGFDGATASPVSQQKASPQEVEKERVMAHTYRSLFGFTVPPTPQQQVPHSPSGPSQAQLELKSPKPDAPGQAVGEEVVIEISVDQDLMTESNDVPAPQTDGSFVAPPEDHRLPAKAHEVEVIEIESSDEEESQPEDEAPEEPSSPELRTVEGRLHSKSPGILDTVQDSQAQDLMVPQQHGDQAVPVAVSQDPITSLEDQQTNDSMLETFIEEDKLYPEPPPVMPQSQPQSQPVPREDEVNATSPPAETSQPTDQQTFQQPSYPSLPMSPSNSQSIQDMVSQTVLDLPDAMSSLLPPTPQLTQAGSSTTHLEELLPAEQTVSQEVLSEVVVGLQEQADGELVAAQERRLEIVEAPESLIEGPQLPEQPGIETPAPTRDMISEVPLAYLERQAEISGVPPEEVPQVAQPPEQPQSESPAPSKEHAEPGRMTRARAKKANRASIIPDAISAYFSPKRASVVVASDKEPDKPTDIADTTTNGHIPSPAKQVQLTNGFSTPLSYFTPLARLDSLLNPSSQGAYGSTNSVDILAVVTKSTTEPVRAKAGPKDYYNIFRITDSSISLGSDVRVEVFRPYKNTLPAAKKGDVILLRAFAVKSRKRQSYLLSSDASAWCVFRYPEQTDTAVGAGGTRKPNWALKTGVDDVAGIVSEEMKGPPVEFGNEEREHARGLWEWWGLTSNGKDDVHDNQAHEGMVETNGHVAVSAGAKL